MKEITTNRKKNTMTKPLSEYDAVKAILKKHGCLETEIDDLDDPKLMQDLFDHFAEDMPYGTQKARDGDPDEWIYDRLIELDVCYDQDKVNDYNNDQADMVATESEEI